MALDDPPLCEMVIAVRRRPHRFVVEWRLFDHGPYPGAPPHPFIAPRPPVLLEEGRYEVGELPEPEPDFAYVLLGPARPAAGELTRWPRTRISLDLGDLASLPVPWEKVVAETLGTGPITVVRRGSTTIASSPSLPFDFRADGGRWFVDDVLDDWTVERAMPAGGLVVHAPGDGSPVDIHHIVLDPPSDDPARLIDASAPPQLVGIWWPSSDGARWTAQAVRLLDLGVAAVVGLSTANPRSARAFFGRLYRKVFHDVPIDVAAREAAREAAGEAGLTPDDMLVVAANPGGETSLLLSRAALRGVEHWTRSAPAPPPVTRGERVSAELEDSIFLRLKEAWDREGQAQWDNMATAEFGVEEHDVALAGATSKSIEALAPAASDALATMRNVGTGDGRSTAPARLLQAWVTHAGARMDLGSSLVVGRSYEMQVQVASILRPDAAATPFPDAALAEVFRTDPAVALDVCFFAVDEDVAVDGPARAQILLPRFDDSSVARVSFRPLQPDLARIRVTVAFRGVLLQSVVIYADATGLHLNVDYVANSDLALLDEQSQPLLSIFTNRSEDGSTHWVGVFAADTSVPLLVSGRPTVISGDDLERASSRLRARLATLSGAPGDYAYADQFAATDAERQRRRGGLVQLALEGYTLWDQLLGANSPSEQRSADPAAVLGRPGVVTIARCDKNATRSVPWASLYDFHLEDSGRKDDDDVPSDIALCGVFDAQIDTDPHFLDDAAACFARPECPLKNSATRLTTVCPFGFLGARYQVEQPLQHVTPTPVGQVPPEVLGQFDQTSFITTTNGPPSTLSMALAVAPDIEDGTDHADELAALPRLSITRQSDYADVVAALKLGGAHFQYFYCHGEVTTGDLRLRLGPKDNPGWLSVSNLSDPYIEWPAEPRPLVFLNGCQTAAVIPETANKFMLALRRLGASAVVGTEIDVFNVLARKVGVEILDRFLSGESLGEAMQAVRLGLLRSRNPLGLIFTLHGPATLHVHDPAGCAWCKEHTKAGVRVA